MSMKLMVLLCLWLGMGHALMITDAGLQPWTLDDSALVIYVSVINNGNKQVNELHADLTLCCLDSADMDDSNKCLTFRPLGDYVEYLKSGESHNFTLIMPTVYPYERHGACTVDVHYDDVYRMQHEVEFDTRLFGDQHESLPEAVRNLTNGLSPCPDVDADPLRDCDPYDCILKYGANRGYYNEQKRSCERAPICPTDGRKTLIFSPKYSACITEELDLRAPIKGMKPFTDSVWTEFSLDKQYGKVCVHGDLKKKNCVCHEGWTTSTNGQSAFDPVNKVYRLCNTMTSDYIQTLKPVALYQGLVAGGFSVFLLVLIFCTISQYKRHIITKRLSQVPVSMLREQIALKEGGSISSEPPVYMALSDYIARVTIPNDTPPEGSEDLTLYMDDVITALQRTNTPGIWQGECRGERGLFSVTSVEFYMPSHEPTD